VSVGAVYDRALSPTTIDNTRGRRPRLQKQTPKSRTLCAKTYLSQRCSQANVFRYNVGAYEVEYEKSTKNSRLS